MADFQTAVFYPLNIFGLFVGQIEFWHLLRITPSILAGFFTFLYLRNLPFVILRPKVEESRKGRDPSLTLRMTNKDGGLSNLASIFGAITFGFSPFILTWGEEVVMVPHSIVWLPLILFSIDKFLALRNKKFLVLIAIACAFSFFGGYFQTTIYLFIFALAYLILRLGIKKLVFSQEGIKLIAALILGVLLASVQLIPSAELFFNSGRATIALRETLFGFLLPIESLLTYLAPDIFGHPATYNFFRQGVAQYYEGIMFMGIGALVFASLAIVALKQDKLVMFMAIFGLISLSTTLDLPTSRLFLSLPIPFLSTSIANRILFVPAFCLAVLASYGVDLWLSQKISAKKILLGLLGIYLFAIFYLILVRLFNLTYFESGAFRSEANATVSLRNLAIPFAVFTITSLLILLGEIGRMGKKSVVFIITMIAFLHIFYFSQKYFSFSSREYIFPNHSILSFLKDNQGYFRSWGIAQGALANNFATQYGLFWSEGYDSLNNRAYGEFTYAMQGNRLSDFVFRADAGLGGDGTAEVLLSNPNRRRLIDLVGVKYVIVKDSDFGAMEENNFVKVFDPPAGGSKYGVFENLEVLPRVFLASNFEVENNRQKIIKKLQEPEFDFKNSLVLEKRPAINPKEGEGVVDIVSYKPNEVIVKTKSSQPKLLFLSDNYYPGWKAQVDGDETEILRANYTFRAVPLLPGEHTVRFYFDSTSFKIGALISLVSLITLIYFVRAKRI